MLHNLMAHICSFENLLAAFDDACKGKRYRDEVLTFKQNLEQNLFDLQKELLSGKYTVGPYREFYVRYPKPRLVMALQFRDRVVQHAIYRQLNPYLEKRYIFHSYACRTGKGTQRAADCVLNWERQIIRKPNGKEWYVLKIDVSKYFYRINHEIALDMFREISDDLDFIALIATIIDNPDVPFGLPVGMNADECPPEMRLFDVGMPIGNLSSQMIANMYLDRLDQYCKHILGIHYYIRYMDDMLVLSDDLQQLHEWRKRIGAFANDVLELNLNKKTSIQKMTRGVEFVGHIITPSGIRIRKSTRKRIKRVLKHICAMYNDGSIELASALDTIQCYRGMLQHASAHGLAEWITEHIVLTKAPPGTEPLRPTPCEPDDQWWLHIEPPPANDWRDTA